jgi:hypothetical protein
MTRSKERAELPGEAVVEYSVKEVLAQINAKLEKVVEVTGQKADYSALEKLELRVVGLEVEMRRTFKDCAVEVDLAKVRADVEVLKSGEATNTAVTKNREDIATERKNSIRQWWGIWILGGIAVTGLILQLFHLIK